MVQKQTIKIDILTLFPEAFSYFDTSIIKRAKDKGIIDINVINIREFSKDKHGKCDDYPFGGGAGMVMTIQPLYDAIKHVKKRNSKILLTSPSGKVFTSQKAQTLATESHIIIVCGHYEGVDARIMELFDIEEISLGDFVLTGGEIPAMAIVDSLSRFIEGVIAKESLNEESFTNGLLEYPQYTRPAKFKGHNVPEVLLSGDHEKVRQFRYEKSLEKTNKIRPDLLGEKNED